MKPANSPVSPRAVIGFVVRVLLAVAVVIAFTLLLHRA